MEEPENRVYGPPEFRPNILLLISGKRKSGKDYFVEMLMKSLGKTMEKQVAVMRIAEPIKFYWAQKHQLDFSKLLDTSGYKEQHRFEMVKWSQEVRALNPGYFNVQAIKMAQGNERPLWICVDIRHRRDYEWFLSNYADRVKRVRVKADEEVRRRRGWNFTVGVDDGPSECDLDDVPSWDLVVTNNGDDSSALVSAVDTVLSWINKSL